MRTTIDLPPELMRAAKVAATQRGLSLKELFSKALAHEVGTGVRSAKTGRVRFPLVGAADTQPTADITNADIDEALGRDDADKYA
ncbi:hypothetical protein [Nocardia carnea]|uniref:hypothetical protein n=1 Tax=Nocardia carnea TaxID=37328 RepID=UPI0024572BED|nr:hypothetical protein [Nocardia carnea]